MLFNSNFAETSKNLLSDKAYKKSENGVSILAADFHAKRALKTIAHLHVFVWQINIRFQEILENENFPEIFDLLFLHQVLYRTVNEYQYKNIFFDIIKTALSKF